MNEVPYGAVRELSAAASPEVASPVNGTPADLREDLEQLRVRARERDQLLDLLRRTRADFENFQKRARREREEVRRYQHGPLALDLLPVLDDLERATAAAERAGDTGPLAQGVELVRTMFLDVLRRHGITPVDALGQKFDPNLHHALAAKAAPGQPANTVVEVVKEGYRIHERLLRPAEVIVAIPSEPRP
jgi:molecular chaperone GrpE